MKTKLPKRISTALLGLVLCANSLSAWAGVASSQEVVISPNGDVAAGSLTAARYSADSVQFISCDTISYPAYPTVVQCNARDKASRVFTCTAPGNGRLAEALMGVTDSSFLFITKDAFGQCNRIKVYNSSIHLR